MAQEEHLSGSAAEKLALTWAKIKANAQSRGYMNPFKTLTEATPQHLKSMSDLPTEERPAGHQKITHGIGGHAKVHFEWHEHNYTGMFQKAENCIVRIANAAEPSTAFYHYVSYNPNMAIKCFRDGDAESANMLTIWEIDGYDVIPEGNTGSCSYFDVPLSNHCGNRKNISMTLKDTFISKFEAVDRRGMMLGLSPMAELTQEGVRVSEPYFPFALVFQPHADLVDVPCEFGDYVSQLRHVGKSWQNKPIYELFALHDPWFSRPSGKPGIKHVGRMVLDSEFLTSMYGDTQLFFRHRFMKDELEVLRTVNTSRAVQWSAYTDPDTTAGRRHNEEEGAAWYRPFLPGNVDLFKKQCRSDAVVGYCLLVGCFLGHGHSHCDGTQCVCNAGFCSRDGWRCEAVPTDLFALSEARVSPSYKQVTGLVIAVALVQASH